MESRSKIVLDRSTIVRLFAKAGIEGVESIAPLGAGEFNALYAVKARGVEHVLKVAPTDRRRMLSYERGMMAEEVRFYAWMREKTPIRVPSVRYADFTGTDLPSPWFIMERLPGTTVDRAGLTAAEREVAFRQTAAMVASLHEVRGAGFGYVQNGLHADWHEALAAMVGNLIEDARRFRMPCPRGRRLLRAVHAHADVLRTVESRLVNFDVWEPNILCERKDGDLTLSWIDPERSFWGDRIADFVCLDFMKMSLDEKSSALSAYNAVASEPIAVTDAERIRFSLMLGYLGLIMEVEKYARYTHFHFGWWRNVGACKLLFRQCFGSLRVLEGRAAKEENPHE
ncbi:MAG: aminoglycoside phosphotransferase family protein [Candidatus Izemoplasmatales bacterium]